MLKANKNKKLAGCKVIILQVVSKHKYPSVGTGDLNLLLLLCLWHNFNLHVTALAASAFLSLALPSPAVERN
jgi:hypothetical protein